MNPRRLASLLPLERVRGGSGSIAAKVSAGLAAGIMAVSCAVAPTALAAEPVGPNPWEGYVTGPRQPITVESIRYQINHPHERFMPEGVNDPNCKLTPEHAEPVVLLHGTESEIYRDYALLGPTLRDQGWCVYALEYGGRNTPESGSTARREGTDPSFGWTSFAESGPQIDRFVREVLERTGGSKVRIIGYSQGALMARYWANMVADPAMVKQVVGLAAPTRGGDFFGAAFPFRNAPTSIISPALKDMTSGSEMLQELNKDGETRPGMEYITIGSKYDEMIPQIDHQPVIGPGARHVWIQDYCPQDHSGHMWMPYNPTTLAILKDVLHDQNANLDHVRSTCQARPLGYLLPDFVVAVNSLYAQRMITR